MVDVDAVWRVLQTVNDPEMPISIVDLGIVHGIVPAAAPDGTHICVQITPTFVGCPALDILRREIVAKVGKLPGIARATVDFIYDPPWSVDDISDAGRESLREFGISTPRPRDTATAVADAPQFVPLGMPMQTAPISCPFCGSSSINIDSPFGPTRCKMIYFCSSCKTQFEHLKRV